ncbi:MAG: hypothetical protein F6K56_05685 [Moorea sp. SIO3G5]|nr:hypothetical protein [Moorena sp. SIO3G5]
MEPGRGECGNFIQDCATPDSRLPTPDSRLPTPDSRLPIPETTGDDIRGQRKVQIPK